MEIKKITYSYPHHHFIPSHNSNWWPWYRSNILLHWCQDQKSELTCSWIDFISNPCGQPFNDIPMHHYCYFAGSTPFVLLLVVVHSGCCQIFYIWNHGLLGDPFKNISWWYLRYPPIITISMGLTIPLKVSLFATLVTSCNWLSIGPYSRVIVFYFVAEFTTNFLHSPVEWIFNCNSGSLQK